MGCQSSKPVECGPVEESTRKHPKVKLSGGNYYYGQTFAIVRHADRMDHTQEWLSFPDREKWPNDTPLNKLGHEHATQVGQELMKGGTPYTLIVASPYLRCAQTAARIAEVLDIPVQFDLDLGEVFDNMAMRGVVDGEPQHRPATVLQQQLKPDFPEVKFVRDEYGDLTIKGKLPKFPEDISGARMRFCFKVKKLVQKAASQLMNIIIVTHGDALDAVLSMMRPNFRMGKVPFAGYAIASRQVKVLQRGSEDIIANEPVYKDGDSWKLTFSKGYTATLINQVVSIMQNEEKAKKDIAQMDQQEESQRSAEGKAPAQYNLPTCAEEDLRKTCKVKFQEMQAETDESRPSRRMTTHEEEDDDEMARLTLRTQLFMKKEASDRNELWANAIDVAV